jgi:lipoprotein-anchoring transpeptidase ErfK/SrfK
MFQHQDDLTREELDTQNQEVIGFLNHVYSATHEPATTQAVARVRERLQREGKLKPSVQRSHLRLVGEPHIASRQPRQRGFRRSFTILSAIALLTIVVGGSFLVFSRMQQPGMASGPWSSPISGTPMPTPGANSGKPTPAVTPAQGSRAQLQALLDQLVLETKQMTNNNLYHNKYDGKDYALLAGYSALIGELQVKVQDDLKEADIQQRIDQANNALFNLSVIRDIQDPAHDAASPAKQLLGHYQLKQGTVVIVSMRDQNLQVYQNGKLLRTIAVTTGRVEVPSLPGSWQIIQRTQDTIFKSSAPKDSPFWYPDTAVQYAIEYRTGGYYLYGTRYRTTFGPGSQFPHKGTANDINGTVGGVEMSVADAQWLFGNTDVKTSIIVY